MGKTSKAVQVAERAISDLMGVTTDDRVLVISDDSGMQENREVIEAMLGLARSRGADANLVVIDDVPPGVEAIPKEAKRAMDSADVLIGATLTTAASVIHHEYPVGLRKDGQLRGLFMVKRSFDALTSACVLEADYDLMLDTAERISAIVEAGSEIRVESDIGTDLTASLEGMPSKYSDFAHQPGELAGISWGEVAQGPKVGTADGTVVIDGPVLEYGWPASGIELRVIDGEVTSVSGDGKIAPRLEAVIEENDNAENLAEISFGTNPTAELEETNIWKKGRGRTHIAVGNGLGYGQPVDSPVHIDMVMNTASVWIDDEQIIDRGEFVA